jgi:hypothetical protein
VFRRRRAADEADEVDGLDDELDVEDEEWADEGSSAGVGATAATTGPWDEADAPDDDDTPRVDLGSLLVPVPSGVEMRVDMQDQTVVAVNLVDGHSTMQVHAFAAPKRSGIWDEVRDEITASLKESGASPETGDGPFGGELFARVPVQAPPGAPQPPPGQTQPLRFIGVDGPRWFLRGLLTGPAATDANQATRLLDVFKGIVVVRGGEAMAPRDVLPLRLPRDAMAQAPEPEPAARPGLEMLERGPEITETR